MIELETQRQSVPRSDDGELDTTMAFLRFVRGCVVKKLDGLDEEEVRRPVVASGTSLLGLVWHLAVAERYWVGWTFAGLLDDAHDWDFGMDVPDGSTVADVIEEYAAAARDTDAIVAAAAGAEARVARTVDGRHLSLRWVLAHLTGETTRHAGHADILRELIDGTTGR